MRYFFNGFEMKIRNIRGLSAEDLQREADQGARFVYYTFTISLLIVTFKRKSGIYLLRNGDNGRRKGIPFILLSFLFGWWGIPSGPGDTVESIRSNLRGGNDITDEIMATVAGHLLFKEAELQKKVIDHKPGR